MEIKTIQDLFADTLSGLRDAERTLCRVLAGMANSTGNEALAEALLRHSMDAGRHMKRLEKILEILDIACKGKQNRVMREIIAEIREFTETMQDRKMLDVALVTCARKIKHHEMATYSSLSALAQELGHVQIGELLNQSLGDKIKADEALRILACKGIYEEAHKKAA